MRLLTLALLVTTATSLPAAGLLIPEDRKVPPLAMVSHRVNTSINDQVGITTIEQVFRNHTERPLEATYLFPVPKGASVDKFTLWIDGKETTGELLDSKKAQQIYTDIVRRTKDPGLLEYVGHDLFRMRIFPVPARGDARVKVRFSAVAFKDHGIIEYSYPLRTDGKATKTLEEFSVHITINSQHPISTIYSPTHAITVHRGNNREATVEFEKKQALLDKDFQLFYAVSDKEVGLTPITYRPITNDDGYFMFLVSPDLEITKSKRIPRDLVLVLDTSGSMTDAKMTQARKALKFCLNSLRTEDRFALMNFATIVSTFKDELVGTTPDNLERANKWIDDLRPSGGTAILPALLRSLEFRPKLDTRPFTIVFFTDGMPTVDETDPVKIVKSVAAKNSSNTRIFTFGVGDDVNAAMLDQIAESTKAVSTYVRPTEDLESKVSSLHNKISQPVLTSVRIESTNVRLHEIYPPLIGDLFFGSQLVVLGRYAGQGPAVIKLIGQVGAETKEFEYELTFPARTKNGKDFVEHLWARRKVGYILDQIRMNGENKELVDEVKKLAKKYGIATPYTSYLVIPDSPVPVAESGRGAILVIQGGYRGRAETAAPGAGNVPAPNAPTAQIAADAAAKAPGNAGGGIAGRRGEAQDKRFDAELKAMNPEDRKKEYAGALAKARKDARDQAEANKNYRGGRLAENQSGTLGVDLAIAGSALRNQERLIQTANRAVHGRNCVEIGGVWIDDEFESNVPMLAMKAQGDAYFRLLEKKPEMKDVYMLGNHIVWICPNGTALVIDANEGQDKIEDTVLDSLFRVRK